MGGWRSEAEWERQEERRERARRWLRRIWPWVGDPLREAKLRRAAQMGDLSAVEGFLAKGVNPRALGQGDMSALASAADNGDARMLRVLLPRALPESWSAHVGSALMRAARAGSAECVALLLPHSDPKERMPGGESALVVAAEAGCSETIQILLGFCPLDSRCADGSDALMRSALYGRAAAVVALLAAGADPLARRGDGATALMLAAQSGDEQSALALLPVSDLSARCERGLGASDWARESRLGESERIAGLTDSFGQKREIARELTEGPASSGRPKWL